MLQISSESNNQNGYLKKSPFTLLLKIFKKNKYEEKGDLRQKNCSVTEMERGSNASVTRSGCSEVPRVPSTLSVSAVDVMVRAPYCPPSPAISTLTLTPGRTRDIDQDMAALRLSRQDNPFLQVLASRESLVDSLEESESDDANLMSQEFPSDLDVDPLTLPEIHEHMIRSPPPVTWPKSPNFKVFRFPLQSCDDDSSQESLTRCCGRKTPVKVLSPKHSRGNLNDCVKELSTEALSSCHIAPSCKIGSSPNVHQRTNTDSTRERSPKPFSLLNPEVRRLNVRSCDDNVQLVSKNDEYDKRLELDIAPNLPIITTKRPA